MGKDLKFDGIGWNADFVKSFEKVEDCVSEFLQPHYDHWFEGLNKKERTAKIKEVHKICTK